MAESAAVDKVIRRCVLALWGKSLLIEGIKATLQGRDGVEVVILDTSRPGAIQKLDELSPDIVMFDLPPSLLTGVFTFMRNHADVISIGLDIDSDLALLLSQECRILPTMADLMQVIDARIHVNA